MTDHIPLGTKPTGTAKDLVTQLREALNLYGRHLGWCQKMGQMPMESGRTYMCPTDWDNWRSAQPCTCKWDEVANTLVRSTDETVASPVHQLCLAYEQGFGQGGRLVINPYPPGSDGFEAWEIGRHEWTMRQRGALKAFAGRSGIQGPGDEDQNSRLAPSAAVHLCAPHGKDWLTCPECAKAAGIGPASQ